MSTKRFNTRNSSQPGQRRNFVTGHEGCLPRSEEGQGSPARLKTLNGPNHEPVVPFGVEGASPPIRQKQKHMPDSEFVFSAKTNLVRSTRATLDYSRQQTSLSASKLIFSHSRSLTQFLSLCISSENTHPGERSSN